MFGMPSQILRFKTASERVAKNIIKTQKSANHSDYEDLLTRMISSIENIVIPILHSNTEDIENQFDKQVLSVGALLKEINEAIYEQKNDDLSEVTKEVLVSYDLLKQDIRTDPAVSANIRAEVLEILDSLKDFDNIYLGIALTRPKQLEKALVDIDSDGETEDLEKNIAGTALAFFSVLFFAKQQIKDDEKFKRFLKIAHKYCKDLEAWADTIDIMTNPESVEAIKEAEKIAPSE